MSKEQIATALLLGNPVLIYFDDSRVPGTVLKLSGDSVLVKHGEHCFWYRLNNKHIRRIECYPS